MKKAVLFSAIGVLSASIGQVASAQETGRVVSSTPVVQQVAVPRQVCNTQPMVQQQSSGGGAVIGAIVGGLLGNTIGHGMGRAAATGIGVVAGAGIGDSVENRGQQQFAQACSTQTTYENRTVGYNVVYEYAGKQYSTQLPYDPGQSINLQLTPVGGAPMAPANSTQGRPGMAPPVVVAPPMGQSANVQPVAAPAYEQPVATIVPSTMVYPAAYPVYGAPYYYGAPAFYPPIGLSLNLGYSRGWGGHHHGGHWR
ncbi:MAG: glycine zipper 2TM domain-containing protein [Pseudomonadota bacterium]